MLYGTICTLFFIFNMVFFDPDTVLNKKILKVLKKWVLHFLLIQIIAFFNYILFLNLITKNEISYLVPLNQLFVILFSSIIGILFLKEK